mmetsp:Transcript_34986/g.63038  ORF Transcript_34986/g.63038 Transcript_34986/m.63038 type:complete len:205 (+) Transcript_34986:645-1259(+)
MPRESVETAPTPHFPHLRRVVEGPGEDLVPIGVEIEGNDFGRMSLEGSYLVASLHVPKLRSVVHAPCRHVSALQIERHANDLCLVTLQRVNALPCVGIPKLGCLVETASHDLVATRVVEGNGIHNVLVSIKGEELFTAQGVPDTAGSVIGASDEFGARLVESTVRERQDVCTQDLEQVESLIVLVVDLVDELVDHLSQRLSLVL